MKNELHLYVLIMAISLPLQYLGSMLLPDVSLMELLFEGQTSNPISALSDYLVTSFVAIFLYLCPGVLTAFWVYQIRSISIEHRWAWIIVSLFLEYFLLLFYIAVQMYENEKIIRAKT